MVLGSHANTRAMYSTPPWPSLAASMAAYRRRSFSDNPPKNRRIFSSISAEYTSMLDSLSQNLCYRKDTTAQACREVILDHILIDVGDDLRRLVEFRPDDVAPDLALPTRRPVVWKLHAHRRPRVSVKVRARGDQVVLQTPLDR